MNLFLVSLPSICALLTSCLSLILFTIMLLLTWLITLMPMLLLKPNTTSAELFDAITHGFTFISTMRLVPDSCTSSIIGGALHFFSMNLAIFSPHLLLLSNPLNCQQSWSNFGTLIWLYITSIVFLNLLQNLLSFSQFLEDYQTLFSSVSISREFLITGNFNIHVDDLTD